MLAVAGRPCAKRAEALCPDKSDWTFGSALLGLQQMRGAGDARIICAYEHAQQTLYLGFGQAGDPGVRASMSFWILPWF